MTAVRKAGVLGHPIEHSLSPVLHRAAYQALGLDWEYNAYDVTADQLEGFIAGLDASWAGLSLTMPLKVEALAHLHFVEPMAKMLGAVNTVLFDGGGGTRNLVGANTDVYGVKQALREAGSESVNEGVILGGGATATAAMAAVAELGCKAPTIVVRNRARTGGLIRAAAKMGSEPRFTDFGSAPSALARADAVVSTVPAEVGGELGKALLDVQPGAFLMDAVYDPPETPLQEAWSERGGTTVGGTRMLLMQAAEQVRLMTGRAAPIGQMDVALVSHLSLRFR